MAEKLEQMMGILMGDNSVVMMVSSQAAKSELNSVVQMV
jgi:hypothetical protein